MMTNLIALPSLEARGHLAIDRALAAFDRTTRAGVEDMLWLALDHSEPEVRARAALWCFEVLNVKVIDESGKPRPIADQHRASIRPCPVTSITQVGRYLYLTH